MRILYHPKKKSLRIRFGLLYNGHAAVDARNIMPSGWHVPTRAEHNTLITYLGGISVAAIPLKEVGDLYWGSSNNGSNTTGFSARGAGYRNTDGIFAQLYLGNWLWSTSLSWIYLQNISIGLGSGVVLDQYNKLYGLSIRGIKDDTTDPGTMTGNDGKVYPTVTIGTQVWMAANLAETKYRNGDAIPEVTGASEWAALTTGALCAYENDWNNV